MMWGKSVAFKVLKSNNPYEKDRRGANTIVQKGPTNTARESLDESVVLWLQKSQPRLPPTLVDPAFVRRL